MPNQNLEAERRKNAQIIIQTGLSMGASQRDILIALMTAMQESGLRNLNYGDRDSLGLFQQRPSQGWGSPSQVMNPQYASRKFFEGLMKLGSRRNNMSLTQAAQAVQRSAFPNAYAKHEGYARSLLASLGGGQAQGVGPALQSERRPRTTSAQALGQGRTQREPGVEVSPREPMNPNVGWTPRRRGPGGLAAAAAPPQELGAAVEPAAKVDVFPDWEPPPGVADIASAPTSQVTKTADQPIDVSQWTLDDLSEEQYNQAVQAVGGVVAGGKAGDIINYAKQFLGVPYKWGGAGPLGFDCSGLLYYVYRQFGVNLPRVSFQQAAAGPAVSRQEAKPGDLAWWDNSPRNNGADHIAIFLGNNQVLEALKSGTPVQIRTLSEREMQTAGFTRVL